MKQKLELTWIGKDNPEYDISNIEPRILEENPKLSYGDKDTKNMIIHGDNLLALKALLRLKNLKQYLAVDVKLSKGEKPWVKTKRQEKK